MIKNEVLMFLYYLGCQYSITDEDMKVACVLLGVDFAELQKFNGISATKSADCSQGE